MRSTRKERINIALFIGIDVRFFYIHGGQAFYQALSISSRVLPVCLRKWCKISEVQVGI